jgi:hypothetical protein
MNGFLRAVLVAGVFVAALVLTLVVVACGGKAAAPKVHIHGNFAEVSLVDGNCGLSPGDQVKITSGSGKLLAVATLGQAKELKIHTQGLTVPQIVYPWSASGPAEARYGLTVSSMPVYYASEAALRKGVDLSC